MALASVLNGHQQFCQSPVHIVSLKLTAPILAVLMDVGPMAHHNERSREVQPMIGTTLAKHFLGLRLILLGVSHTACRPFVQFINDMLNSQFTLHTIQLESPLFQSAVALEVNVLFATHHLKVR